MEKDVGTIKRETFDPDGTIKIFLCVRSFENRGVKTSYIFSTKG